VVMCTLALLLLVGCQSEKVVDTAVYRQTLNELIEEVIAISLPLAETMAQGQTPTAEQVEEAQNRITAVQTQLDALGAPPTELVEANGRLSEAVQQFQQAYNRLASNLENGITPPFDQEFLTLAANGGKAVHEAAAELTQ
jgi:chromosome segregation ATPase